MKVTERMRERERDRDRVKYIYIYVYIYIYMYMSIHTKYQCSIVATLERFLKSNPGCARMRTNSKVQVRFESFTEVTRLPQKGC